MKITILAKPGTNLLSELSYILAKARIHVDDMAYEIFGEKEFVTFELKTIKKITPVLLNNGFTIVSSTNFMPNASI